MLISNYPQTTLLSYLHVIVIQLVVKYIIQLISYPQTTISC